MFIRQCCHLGAAGVSTISATLEGDAVRSATPTVTFVDTAPAPVDLASSTIQVDDATVAAGGTTTITVTLVDTNGDPVVGASSTLAIGVAPGTIGDIVDNGDGTYTATLTVSNTAGDVITVGADVGGAPITSGDPTVTVVPGSADAAQSSINLVDSSGVFDVAATGTLRVTLAR